jgi:hypothetical protein
MRKIMDQFSNAHTSKKAYFEKEFAEARMLAQFESINQLIIKNNFLYAYYNACALQDIYPQQTFLKQAESAALYALYRYKATGNYDKASKSSKLPAGVQFPAYVLEKMSRREFAVFTLRTLWKVYESNSTNDYVTLIFNDMVKEVVKLIGSLDQFCNYRMKDTLVAEQKIDTTTNKGRYDRYKEKNIVPPSPNFKIENYMLADLKIIPTFSNAFLSGILAAEQAAVDNFISKYRKKTKEKTPVVIFQPSLELKSVSTNNKKKLLQTSIFENDCKKVAKSCSFSPQMISSLHYSATFSYPVYIRLLELEQNISKIVPLAYETRHVEVLSDALGTPYINFVELTKIKNRLRYSAGLSFIMYDLKNKKYLYNTIRNFNISDKSELYQMLYENYNGARKSIKE